MKPAISKRKLGTPYFYDKVAGIEMKLPENYLIYNYNRKVWLGGSTDGTQLLHIERVSNTNGSIPTILAEGDLDLFICSTSSQIDIISNQIKGIEMEGTLSGTDIKGYLAMVDLRDESQYLVLIAGNADSVVQQEKELAIRIAASLVGSISIAA